MVGTAVGTATILRTTDGGQNWTPQSVAFAGDLYDVEFAGDLRGWTVGQTGRIYSTSNGGTVTGVDERAVRRNRMHIPCARIIRTPSTPRRP